VGGELPSTTTDDDDAADDSQGERKAKMLVALDCVSREKRKLLVM